MSHAQQEMIRLGRWAMKGHIPPFPPGDAPAKAHDGGCKLCGEHEFKARKQRDAPLQKEPR